MFNPKLWIGIVMLGVGAISTAQAQTAPPVSQLEVTGVNTAKSPAADTVQAIHQLFQNRRRGGRFFTGAGGLGVVGAVSILAMPATSSEPDFFTFTPTDKKLMLAVVIAETLPLLGLGISKLHRFSKKEEEALVQQYQAGSPLSAAMRRRLCPKYFRVWHQL